jgi:hypothetical protein
MRVSFHRAGAGCVVAVLIAAAGPLAAAEFTPVPGKEFRETINARIPVSGESVVGVTIPPADAKAAWQGLWVKVPAGIDLRDAPLLFSVEIVSADAVYRGAGELNVKFTQDDDEWQLLPIQPTGKHIQTFLEGGVLAVKVLATVPRKEEGARQGSEPKTERVHLVATWVNPATLASDAPVRLQVNSQRGDIFLYGERCTSVRWDRRTRFDAVCDLSLSRMPEAERANTVKKVTLLRRDGAARSSQDIKLLY